MTKSLITISEYELGTYDMKRSEGYLLFENLGNANRENIQKWPFIRWTQRLNNRNTPQPLALAQHASIGEFRYSYNKDSAKYYIRGGPFLLSFSNLHKCKEQVMVWSRIRPPLRISLLEVYITSQLWPPVWDDDTAKGKVMSGNAGQLAKKVGESLTKPWLALWTDPSTRPLLNFHKCEKKITVQFAWRIFFKTPTHPYLHLVQIGKTVRTNGPTLNQLNFATNLTLWSHIN